MDFGKFQIYGFYKGVAPANTSSDILAHRIKKGKLQVLVGIREGEPWNGYTTVPFGGYVEDKDVNIRLAAHRDQEEENFLKLEIEFYIGIYGPERYHYTFDGRHAHRTSQNGHTRPVVANVFAGRVVGGTLKDSDEQQGLRWVYPEELANVLLGLAFDHARALADFLDAIEDGSAQTWRKQALALVK